MVSTPPVRSRGPWELALSRLRADRAAKLALLTIAAFTLVALGAPLVALLTGHGPAEQFLSVGLSPEGVPLAPNRLFWLGTDGLGRDLLVRIVYGTRVSLLVGLLASISAMLMGTTIGIAAGWFSGVIDRILSRTMDIFLSLPFLVFALALVAVTGPSLAVSVGVIAMFSWASVGRIIRSQTVAMRTHEFVQAARLLGASNARIMLVEILPNVTSTVIVYSTLLIPGAIVAESTLSFLGLSVRPPTPSWGNILAEAVAYYRVAWWLVIFPGVALLLVTIAFNVLGDSVRDALDPKRDQGGTGATP